MLDVAPKINIVLVEPSHPGNIGAVARAMKTMGLCRLSLVTPRTFPSAEATARAAGADDVLHAAALYTCLEQALIDSTWVVGTSARGRHIAWPEVAPAELAERVATLVTTGVVSIVFGREQSGLTNAELDRCHAVVRIPSNPQFSSLNLASAVQIIGYEIRKVLSETQPSNSAPVHTPVSNIEMEGFFAHLRETLIEIGYLDESKPKLLMRRLRKLFNRAAPDRPELNILRGVLGAMQRDSRNR